MHTARMQQKDDLKAKLFLLVEKHCATIRSEAQAINSLMHSAENGQNSDSFQKIFFLTHKLKGSSGTMGFMQVSHIAEQLEDQLKGYIDAKKLPLAQEYARLQSLNHELQKSVACTHPNQSALLDRYR